MVDHGDWRNPDGQHIWETQPKEITVLVRLIHEDSGGFSAQCMDLPGVISEGESENEAIANLEDAFRLTLDYYREALKEIPWQTPEPRDESGIYVELTIDY